MKKIIFTILMMVAATFAATSCGLEGGEGNGGENTSTDLTISIDTPVIRADGKSAAKITVKLGDEVVTDGVTIYDGVSDTPMQIPDFSFTTTAAGVYSFWATYKTFHTGTVSVTAITSPLPELPADSQPSNTSFTKKVFINQFTGTNCGYCPYMISILENMAEAYPGKFVLAACHTYNKDDPAFIDYSIDNAMAVSGYPTVVLNLDKTTKFSDYTKPSQLRAMFEEDYGNGKVGTGISVATLLDGQNLVVKAQVKVAEAGRYRVGAWLLEDGIKGKQAGSSTIDTHDNCVRDIYSKNTATDYSGTLHIMEAGQTAEQFFLATIDSSWKAENCHIAVFICSQKANGNYAVTNVIDCPVGKSLAYSYAN
ncbi:MAG: Omp28-related outer membrane protein [Candidatus Cryptobacteroides sp.]